MPEANFSLLFKLQWFGHFIQLKNPAECRCMSFTEYPSFYRIFFEITTLIIGIYLHFVHTFLVWKKRIVSVHFRWKKVGWLHSNVIMNSYYSQYEFVNNALLRWNILKFEIYTYIVYWTMVKSYSNDFNHRSNIIREREFSCTFISISQRSPHKLTSSFQLDGMQYISVLFPM